MVKDEHDNLPACLASAAGLFDEVVVVDTGSTDDTRAIALGFGARVFDFPWADSFSAARNAGLEHATGDWIFWLDADDRLDAANRDKLRALLDGLGFENAAYSLKCLCLPDPRTGGGATEVDHVRLFRRHPKVRWRYRVHEQILGAVKAAGGHIRWADVVIHHTGYQDPALRARKLARDLRLLQLEHAEQPDDPFTLFNLGQVHHELGRPAEALPFLRQSLAGSHPQDSIVRKLYSLIASCHIRLGERAEALAACAEGRRAHPADGELLFLEALLREQDGDLDGATACLLAVLNFRPGPHFASVDPGLRSYRARHQLALLCRKQGQPAQAESLWRTALEARPDFLPGWLGLAELCLDQARWSDLPALLAQVEALPQGPPEAALLRGRAHLARRDFPAARAALEEALARWPDSLPLHVQLSHVLLQQGNDPDAAERLLRDVLARDPHNAGARHNLTVLLAQRFRARDAAFLSQEAPDKDGPTRPDDLP
jgi:tetratricopeptide (TPR) repeat protein